MEALTRSAEEYANKAEKERNFSYFQIQCFEGKSKGEERLVFSTGFQAERQAKWFENSLGRLVSNSMYR